MTEDELRKFDKEVLVQFIFGDSVFSRERTMEQLCHYEKRFRFKKLTEKAHKLLDKMQSCSSEEYFAEWDSHYKHWQRVQRQLNKILGE